MLNLSHRNFIGNNQDQDELKRELSLLDGIMLVSGSMIGSGIFIISANMMLNKATVYPVLPAVYVFMASVICIALLIDRTSTCGWGVVIMLSGIPVYYLTKKDYPRNKNF